MSDKKMILGDVDVKDLRLGSVQVLSAYIGNEIVWSHQSAPKDNEIWYTTNQNQILTLMNETGWNESIVSHTYQDGKGVITFDGPVTFVPASGFASTTGATNRLSTIQLPSMITGFGIYAFRNSYLTELTIPQLVTAIPNYMCYSATSLSAVNLNENLETIGTQAFNNCRKLISVYIPSSVTGISPLAFTSCRSLSSITVNPLNQVYDSRDNCNAIIETSTNTLLFGSNQTTVVPNTVTLIGGASMPFLSGITSITIPDSVTGIGGNAFESASLRTVTIGSGLSSVSGAAFARCGKLSSITISTPTAPTLENANVFSGVPSTGIIRYNFGVDYSTWKSNQYISGWTFDDSLTEIPSDEIWYTSNNGQIVQLSTGASVVQWGPQAYYDSGKDEYTNGKGIYHFTNSITEIPPSVFSGKGFVNIGLPSTVTGIGKNAFQNCYSLTDVNLPDNIATIGSGAFTSCSGMQRIKLPSSITEIPNQLLSYCTNLNSVTIQGQISKIGTSAFTNCFNLSSVTFTDLVQIQGNHAFENAFALCSGLTSVKVPKLECISGSSAMAKTFRHVGNISMEFTALTGIYGTRAVEFMFQDSSISALSCPNLTTISGDYALNLLFYSTNKLKRINFPKLSAITGNSVFYEFLNGPAGYIESATVHPNTVSGTSNNNILGHANTTSLTYLRFIYNATTDVHLEKQSALDFNSVLSVLTHLSSSSTGKVTFYTYGLTVTDDANHRLRTAYDNAVANGWTIYNLTIQ